MKTSATAGPISSPRTDLMQAHAAEASFPAWKLFTALAMIAMQLAWLVPWYQLLTRLSAPISARDSYLFFGGLMLAAFFLNLAAILLTLRENIRRGLLLGLLAAGVLIGLKMLVFRYIPMTFQNVFNRRLDTMLDISALVRPEILVVLFAVLAWQRGMTLAQDQLGPQAVLRQFRNGVFALLVYAIIASRLVDSPVFSLSLFILSGLLAMAGARFTFLGQIRGGRKVAFQPLWVLGLLGAGLLLLAMTAALGGIAENVFAGWVADAFAELWDWTSAAILTITGPLVVIVVRGWLRFLAWFSQFNDGGGEMNQDLFGDSFDASVQELEALAQPPAWIDKVGAAAQAIIIFIVLLIVAVIAVYAVRRYRQHTQNWVDEERESLFSAGELGSLLRRMFQRQQPKAGNRVSRLTAWQQRRAAARIRQIYSALLKMGEEFDVSRPAACTPREYLPYLNNLLPGSETALGELTEAYLRIRYGELPETAVEVQRVEKAWEQVQAGARERKREQLNLRRRVRTDDDDWRGSNPRLG